MLILGIESSCDETAASVARNHTEILSNVVSSQVEEHKQYGGVVPEIASRRHCENVLPVVQKALDDAGVTLAELDGIAVTAYPGLIGALLVGVNFAKGLALTAGKPLVPRLREQPAPRHHGRKMPEHTGQRRDAHRQWRTL